jgi:hypothetical protein
MALLPDLAQPWAYQEHVIHAVLLPVKDTPILWQSGEYNKQPVSPAP